MASVSPTTNDASALIRRAIDVFAGGFTFTRSMTHPYLAERVGPLLVLRDAPRKRDAYRSEEWIAYDTPPEMVHHIAATHTRGRYALCVICREDAPNSALRLAYKQLGYRLRTTEPLMVHPLKSIPRCTSPATIVRVTDPELAQRVNQQARSRQISNDHLTDPAPLRQYVALIDDTIAGYVRSIVVGDSTWCSNMYVMPEYRRRGIARAMLCHMLHDDRAAGSTLAVLLASHVGARLYPVVGYRQIATLLLYSPKKAPRPSTSPKGRL